VVVEMNPVLKWAKKNPRYVVAAALLLAAVLISLSPFRLYL
jgi:preprotein translocase subunit Sec61beta